jgi:hypothetical protein
MLLPFFSYITHVLCFRHIMRHIHLKLSIYMNIMDHFSSSLSKRFDQSLRLPEHNRMHVDAGKAEFNTEIARLYQYPGPNEYFPSWYPQLCPITTLPHPPSIFSKNENIIWVNSFAKKIFIFKPFFSECFGRILPLYLYTQLLTSTFHHRIRR